MNKPLTIVNVEDKADNLAEISEFLDNHPRFKLLAHVNSGKDAIRVCHEFMPDITIINSDIADMVHNELIKRVHKLCPASCIFSVRESHSVDEIAELLILGARYFTDKERIIGYLNSLGAESGIFTS